jgi:nucleoside-diphosphate-sugar epimerase
VSPVVLVTGASGAVGRLVLARLGETPWRTRALIHRNPVSSPDESVAGDLADRESLCRALVGADAVLHLAAATRARRASVYERVNVEGTRNLLAAAQTTGVRRFVHVSTRAIDPAGGAYSASKARAEADVAAADVEHVIVRLPELYGAGEREGLDKIVAHARRGHLIPVVGRGQHTVCPVFAEDAAAAVVAALQAPAGKTYTLAGACLCVREFAEACVTAFRSSSRVVGVPEPAVAALSALSHLLPLPLVPGQLARLRAPKPRSSAEAEQELGFRPRPLEEGLQALGRAGR